MATSNSLEWVLRIKDLASGVSDKVNASLHKTKDTLDNVNAGAVKMASSASKALNSLYDKTKTAIKGSDFLNASVEELKARLDEVNKVRLGTVLKSEFNEASKEAKALENQIKRLEQGISGSGIGSKIAGWRKDFASSLPGANLIKNPLAGAMAIITGIGSATKKAMEDQVQEMKFITATGSEQIGSELFDGITQFAARSGFGEELNDVVMKMIGQNVDSTKILPIMEQMGDISQGSTAGMEKLSGAFQAVSNRGLMSERRLRDLRSIGFDPLRILAENTEETLESLNTRMSKGQIDIADLTRAMEYATAEGGDFHGVIDKIANTPEGQLRILRENLDKMMKQIGKVFLPIAHRLMEFLNWIAEKAGPFLKPFVVVLGSLAAALLTVTVAQWAMTTAVWANTAALLANPITWIVVAIASLIAIIVTAINKYHEWGAAMLLLMGPFYTIINAIMALKNNWESIKEAFSSGGILAGLKRIGVVLLDAVLYPVQQLLNMLAKIPGLSKLAKGGADKIAAIRKNLNLVDPEGKKNKVEDPRGVHNSDGTSGATQTNESIVTGGTRNTTINMTIGNIVETLNLKAQDLKEGAQQTQDELAAALLRALAMATTTAG